MASSLLAFISILCLPFDVNYLSFIDFKVLGCLFCLMLVVSGFKRMLLFTWIATKLLIFTKNPRQVSLLLIFLSFFFSMLITNDVALIIFVPLTIVMFSLCSEQKPILLTIILQTLAANIGSSLTPIGNPQNLYLYSYYAMHFSAFLSAMAIYVTVGGMALLGLSFLVSSHSPTFSLTLQQVPTLKVKTLMRYMLLFIISLGAVFNLVPWHLALVLVLLFSEKILLRNVDYSLLLTFVALFILVGNIGRISIVNSMLVQLFRGSEFYIAFLASQFISNVPAALLLSKFTTSSVEILRGVNVGGCGTLIASMASVISFKLFLQYDSSKTLRYLFTFTLINVGFICIFFLLHAFW